MRLSRRARLARVRATRPGVARAAPAAPSPNAPAQSGAAPTAAAPAESAGEPAQVRVGTIGSLSESGLFIALERGYWQEQGLRVNLVLPWERAGVRAPLEEGA